MCWDYSFEIAYLIAESEYSVRTIRSGWFIRPEKKKKKMMMKLSNLLIVVDSSIHKGSAAWRKEIGFMHITPLTPLLLLLQGTQRIIPASTPHRVWRTERIVQLFRHSALSHITAPTHSASDPTVPSFYVIYTIMISQCITLLWYKTNVCNLGTNLRMHFTTYTTKYQWSLKSQRQQQHAIIPSCFHLKSC